MTNLLVPGKAQIYLIDGSQRGSLIISVKGRFWVPQEANEEP